MKVLHIIPWVHPRYGGPVAALTGLARAQALEGLSVSILATDPENSGEEFTKKFSDLPISIQLFHPAAGPLLRHPKLRENVEFAISQTDVVHIHCLYEEIQHLAATCAHRMGKAYFVRPCGMLDPWSLAQRKWKKRVYFIWRLRRNLQQAYALHFATERERDLARPLGLRPLQTVEPNGIDMAEFNLPGENRFLSRYPQLADQTVVLYLGRLLPTKGLDLLMAAFSKLSLNSAHLVLAGPGEPEYVRTLQRLCDNAGVGKRVTFTGLLTSDLRLGAYRAARIFVLPSHHENFGNVVIESLACGTPVLVSDQVQLYPEVVKAGVGAVFPLEQTALHRLLEEWLGPAHTGMQQARNISRAFVAERFDWREIARRWANHYGQSVQSRGR